MKNTIIVTMIIAILLTLFVIPVWPQPNGSKLSILERLLKIETELVPPVGSIMPYMGEQPPKGWLMCDGTSYSVKIYPNLARVLKCNDIDRFTVPNLKGNFLKGIKPSEKIGATGGSNTSRHTHSIPDHSHPAGSLQVAKNQFNHQHAIPIGAVSDGGPWSPKTGYFYCEIPYPYGEVVRCENVVHTAHNTLNQLGQQTGHRIFPLTSPYAPANSDFARVSGQTAPKAQFATEQNTQAIDNRPSYIGVNFIIKY